MDFSSFGFDKRILSGIAACGYETPSPIQLQAMPAVLAGRDVLGLAQTGTGKTAAFALPLLQRLLNDNAQKRGPIRVLVLSPTRELTLQIHDSFVDLGRQTGLRSAAVFGGVGLNPQIKALAQATVAVACPGRLLDLLRQKQVDLSHVDALVLDEADRMFDMGFLPDLRKIMTYMPSQRQNLLFSATMPPEIRGIADQILRDPAVVQVANTAPAERIRHALYPVAPKQKLDLLERMLRDADHDCVLIFTRTKHRAKSLGRKLEAKGWRATSLQGNLSQTRRQEALEGFREGKYEIMVATDIAARGIDCARVTHVVNFDMPDTAENYTHRIGRTGRADRSGEAMTLITAEDESQVRMFERSLGYKLDRVRVDGFAYAAEVAGESGRDNVEEPRPPRPVRQGPRRDGDRSGARPNTRSGNGRRGPAQGRAAQESRPERSRQDGSAAVGGSESRTRASRPPRKPQGENRHSGSAGVFGLRG